ncbi:hypothetical protein [Azospirillum sp. TSO22-1]|uniref:hypothetical protein n=1 Tax=Azospirillum sp. TSO22-1 TaxID=716789 RepID=UPI001304BBFA|nr:hypothetical protein [Azospirillum sp. TSO22-1]
MKNFLPYMYLSSLSCFVFAFSELPWAGIEGRGAIFTGLKSSLFAAVLLIGLNDL